MARDTPRTPSIPRSPRPRAPPPPPPPTVPPGPALPAPPRPSLAPLPAAEVDPPRPVANLENPNRRGHFPLGALGSQRGRVEDRVFLVEELAPPGHVSPAAPGSAPAARASPCGAR